MPDKDLISRAAVLKEIGAWETDLLEPDGVAMIAACMGAIEKSPAIDAAPVIHGTWEPSPDYPGYHRCSVCKDCYIDPAWLADGKWSFCPNCGARNSMQKRSDTP